MAGLSSPLFQASWDTQRWVGMVPRDVVGRRVSAVVAVSVDPGIGPVGRRPLESTVLSASVFDAVLGSSVHTATLERHLLTAAPVYVG